MFSLSEELADTLLLGNFIPDCAQVKCPLYIYKTEQQKPLRCPARGSHFSDFTWCKFKQAAKLLKQYRTFHDRVIIYQLSLNITLSINSSWDLTIHKTKNVNHQYRCWYYTTSLKDSLMNLHKGTQSWSITCLLPWWPRQCGRVCPWRGRQICSWHMRRG